MLKISIVFLLITYSPKAVESSLNGAGFKPTAVGVFNFMERNYIGNVFGRLTIISQSFLMFQTNKSKTKERFVNAKCKCGHIKSYRLEALKAGRTKSCGCYRVDVNKSLYTKHGLYKNTEICNAWYSMLDRCYNKNYMFYARYGGRGIKVCEEWKNNIAVYYEWAKDRWAKGLEMDRINNNGNYEPLNCRFVTRKENARNRGTVKLTIKKASEIRQEYKSNTTTMATLARHYNVSVSIIHGVIHNKYWS